MNESETALAALALVGGVGATPDAPRPSKVSSGIELRVSDLAAIVETATHKDDYPFCEDIAKGIPVYDGPKIRDSIKCRDQRCEFSHEFLRALSDGPGIVLVRQAWSNLSVLDRVTEAFTQIIVQVPLDRGDAVFFNPAVMHAAGKNASADIYRMANLMLISSPLGVAMESIDSQKISAAVHPELLALLDRGELDAGELDAVISVSADGYAFPTNLDLDPPVDGLSPAAQQDILRRAVVERWSSSVLDEQLSALAARRRAV